MKIRSRDIAVSACTIAAMLTLAALWYAKSAQGPGGRISREIADTLEVLGRLALRSGDVPVAAVVMFGDSIIGSGYNSVLRDSNVAGHAEVNAVSSAIRSIGFARFTSLHRDSLRMISTFEPCPMCRGVILEYGLKRVVYLKPKPLFYVMKEDLRSLLFHWRKKHLGPSGLQDSLFLHHPDYTP